MPLMTIALVSIAVLVGSAVPVQTGANATAARFLGHGLLGALTNTVVASLVLLFLALVLRVPWPEPQAALRAPWWGWAGGFIGAAFVFSSLTIAPKIGVAGYVSASLVGTMLASIVLDHFGWMGFRESPATTTRIVGAAMAVVGMLLVQSTE